MNVFVRSSSVRLDSRLNKYLLALDKNKIKYSVLYWDRTSSSSDEISDNYYNFNLKATHGDKVKNAIKIIKWNIYIYSFLRKNKNKINSVHAVDFDTIIPSFIFCLLFKKRCIFDVYDKYTDSRGINGFIGWGIDKLETYFLKMSDVAILADRKRIIQHGIEKSKNLIIIENVPSNRIINNKHHISNNKKIKFGYVGGLEKKNRGLEHLLEIISKLDEKYELHISGFGELEAEISKSSNNYNNIFFYGPCEHSDGMSMLSECDVIIGMYYLNVENHKYAAPNKYYEHLLLGKPLLTTMGTPPGDKVIRFKTGWAIEDNKDALSNFLNSLPLDEISEFSINARKLWEQKYINYFNDKICIDYLKLLRGN